VKIALHAQIEEVDRELRLRKDVYEIAISKGKMRRSVADHHLDRMEAVRRHARVAAGHEAMIKARLAQ